MGFVVLLAAAFFLMPGPSAHASRFASTNLCADELLLKLADPEEVAAVTVIRGDRESEEILRDHPHIRRIRGEAEELLDLNVTRVFTGPVANPAAASMLQKLGIPVTEIPVAVDLDSIAGMVRRFAVEIGHPERAQALLRPYEEIFKRKQLSPGAGRALFWDAGGHTSGSGTFEHAVLEAAGLENAAAASGIEGNAWLSVEEVIFMKPDYLILRYGHKRNGTGYDGVFHPALAAALPEMKMVYLPRSSLACGGPQALQTILDLQKEVQDA